MKLESNGPSPSIPLNPSPLGGAREERGWTLFRFKGGMLRVERQVPVPILYGLASWRETQSRA